MISFLKLRVSSLLGKIIVFNKMISDDTVHPLPIIEVDGFNLPFKLNSGRFLILANGLLGSGST